MALSAVELDKRFDHHPPDANKISKHQHVRDVLKGAAEDLSAALPDSREASLAFTALEEALMWANAAIARNG